MSNARWVEHNGERVLAEAYDERLHPRGRGGRWIGKLVRVKDAEWQQALNKEATKGKVIRTTSDPRGTVYLGGDMPPSRTGTVLSVDGDKATVKFGDQVRNGVSLTAIEPVEPTMGVDAGSPQSLTPTDGIFGNPDPKFFDTVSGFDSIESWAKSVGLTLDDALGAGVAADDGNDDIYVPKDLAREVRGKGGKLSEARWVEREGQRFLVEADGKCKMPHAAMSKRGKICPNCKAKIGDIESTEEDKAEKVEEARRGQVTDQEIADEARRIEEAADSMRKASTHKHGLEKTPGKSDNWVERTGPGGKRGQLPAYIQHIALALKRKRGMPTSQVIAIAIGTVKRWARGGGNVDANTRAAAAKALAEWAAMKSKAHIKSAVK